MYNDSVNKDNSKDFGGMRYEKGRIIKLQAYKKIEELADSAVCDRGTVWTSLVVRGHTVYLSVMCDHNKEILVHCLEDLRLIEDMFEFKCGKICEDIHEVLYPLGTTKISLSSADLIYAITDTGFVVDGLTDTSGQAIDTLKDIEHFLRNNEGAKMTATEDGRFILTCK